MTYKTAGETEASITANQVRKEVFTNSSPVCWLEDYEKEIEAAAGGGYYLRFDYLGRRNDFEDHVKYKIYVPAKSHTPIVIEVRFFLTSLLNAEQEKTIFEKISKGTLDKTKYGGPKGYINAVKEVCESAVKRLLNGKLSIKIMDGECKDRTFKIEFRVAWVESAAACHYKFNVHNTIQRESVRGDTVSIALATDRQTHAHEYLHCVGLPDEYSYHKTENELIRYYQPDGTLGPPITGVPDEGEPVPETRSILNSDDENLEPRHGFHFAFEIQKIWKTKTGRDIVCEVLKS